MFTHNNSIDLAEQGNFEEGYKSAQRDEGWIHADYLSWVAFAKKCIQNRIDQKEVTKSNFISYAS